MLVRENSVDTAISRQHLFQIFLSIVINNTVVATRESAQELRKYLDKDELSDYLEVLNINATVSFQQDPMTGELTEQPRPLSPGDKAVRRAYAAYLSICQKYELAIHQVLPSNWPNLRLKALTAVAYLRHLDGNNISNRLPSDLKQYLQNLSPVFLTPNGAFQTAEETDSVLRVLLKTLTANPADIIDPETGWNLLHIASAYGNPYIIAKLLRQGNFELLGRSQKQKITPLQCAVKTQQLANIVFLLDQSSREDQLMALISAQDGQGRTALHDAIEKGSLEITRLLLARGADIRAKDYNDVTPLQLCYLLNHKTIIGFLRGNQDCNISLNAPFEDQCDARLVNGVFERALDDRDIDLFDQIKSWAIGATQNARGDNILHVLIFNAYQSSATDIDVQFFEDRIIDLIYTYPLLLSEKNKSGYTPIDYLFTQTAFGRGTDLETVFRGVHQSYFHKHAARLRTHATIRAKASLLQVDHPAKDPVLAILVSLFFIVFIFAVILGSAEVINLGTMFISMLLSCSTPIALWYAASLPLETWPDLWSRLTCQLDEAGIHQDLEPLLLCEEGLAESVNITTEDSHFSDPLGRKASNSNTIPVASCVDSMIALQADLNMLLEKLCLEGQDTLMRRINERIAEIKVALKFDKSEIVCKQLYEILENAIAENRLICQKLQQDPAKDALQSALLHHVAQIQQIWQEQHPMSPIEDYKLNKALAAMTELGDAPVESGLMLRVGFN